MKIMIIGIALATIVAACNNTSESEYNALRLKTTQDSIRVLRDSLRIDSFKKVEVAKTEAVAAQKATRTRSATSTSRTNRSYTSGTNYGYVQPQPAKKGWSSAAKGAVIGGVAGAVTGIAVDKKDGRGAVVGGVVGAGTGYAIGRARDRKTGRVQ